MSDDMKRRQALSRLITYLPNEFQSRFQGLEENEISEQHSSDIARAFQEATLKGAISRRAFFQASGLIWAAGLSSFFLPKKADAFIYGTNGFWHGNSTPTSTALWGTGAKDPYWDFVSLLMNFDGANASTVFSDESNVGRTPDIVGAVIDTNSPSSNPFYGRQGSAFMNGSSDFFTFPVSSDFDFSTGDFTIELWVKFSTALGTQTLYSHCGNSGNWDTSSSGIYIGLSSSHLGVTAHGPVSASGSTTIAANTWYHVALVRSGSGASNVKLYLNGVQECAITYTGAVGSATLGPSIGILDFNGGGRNYLSGFASDLRVYKGLAKYTSGFTRPSAPLGVGSQKDSNWGYCILACPFENSFKDFAGKTSAVSGSAQITTGSSKFGTGSFTMNGSSGSATISTANDLALGKLDYTIEFWVKLNSTSTQYFVAGDANYTIAIGMSSGTAGAVAFWIGNGSSWSVASDSAGSTVLSTGTWYHIALCRSGSSTRLFLNGVNESTVSSSYTVSGGAFTLGALPGVASNYLNGCIDSLRVTRGYARYTSGFTPPSSALPVGKDESTDPFWSSTALAMQMDQLTDSSGHHTLTNNGSVTNNGSIKKYGRASAAFSGSSQYLTADDSTDWNLSTVTSYTVEAWVYVTSAWQMNPITTNDDLSSNNPWSFYIDSDNCLKLYAYDTGSHTAVSSRAVPAYNWTHVAASVSGGTLRVFINGLLLGTATYSGTIQSLNKLQIGVTKSGTLKYFAGYIDDLRITRGVARYVQNFTPPSGPLATS